MGQVFSDTINTGIYVLEPEVLKHVPTDRPYDFSKELFPLLLEMGRPLYGVVCDGYWQDIGNLDQFRQANFDALDGRVDVELPGIGYAGTSGSAKGWRSTTRGTSKDRRSSGTTAGSRRRPPSARTQSFRRASLSASEPASSVPSSTRAHTWGGARWSRGAVIGERATSARTSGSRREQRNRRRGRLGAQSVVYPGVRIYPYKEVESARTSTRA